MRVYARAEDGIKEELFPKEAPRGLYWEDKMYWLKRFVGSLNYHDVDGVENLTKLQI